MKRKLFTKTVAIISLVAVLISPMSVGFTSFAADDTPYKFIQTATDSYDTTFYMELQVYHYGQTFTNGNTYSTYTTGSTLTTTDSIYLNVLFSCNYTTPDDGNHISNAIRAKLIGYANGNTTYEASLDPYYEFDLGRVSSEMVSMARISKTAATENNFGSPYRSPITRGYYDFMMTRSRNSVFEHGYDYLGD